MNSEPIDLGDMTDLANGKLRCFSDIGPHGVVVCRVAGQLYAVDDNCSHRDAKLSDGRLRGAVLTCALHGAQYDVRDGHHHGPPAVVGIAAYRVTETTDGAILER